MEKASSAGRSHQEALSGLRAQPLGMDCHHWQRYFMGGALLQERQAQ